MNIAQHRPTPADATQERPVIDDLHATELGVLVDVLVLLVAVAFGAHLGAAP